jgi:alpha-D-xyloside xylohydrolase
VKTTSTSYDIKSYSVDTASNSIHQPPELYIRWAQWGLLSPLSRFHGANCPREPWHFGETAVAVVRHYAKLRYRLIPYLKQCAEEAYTTGVPILRHLHLEYPNEPGTEFIDDQYLLGPDLLVAPVFESGATERTVYFPSGEWIDLDDSSNVYDGPRWHTVSAPLERIPLFRRAGSEGWFHQAFTMN